MTDDWPEEYDLASDAVKDCAESVAESNPDLTKSQSFAICQDMENEGQLAARENAGASQPFRALADAPMEPPGPVSRVEQDDGSVRYKNLCILAPGEWVDGATEESIYYAPELAEAIAAEPGDRVVRNQVNLDHENRDQLKRIGHFDESTLEVDPHGNLFADVILHRRTTHSQDTAGLMDLALETEGAQGAGGPSVEIPFENEVIEYDEERGMDALVGGDLSGLAIVTDSASVPTAFQEQFPNRAIAMSTAGEAVRVLSRGQSALSDTRQAAAMATEEYRELKSDIESIQETVDDLQGLKSRLDQLLAEEEEEEEPEEPEADPGETETPAKPGEGTPAEPSVEAEEGEGDTERELQDMEAVQSLLEQYLGEVEGDAPVAEFVSWAADQDEEAAAAVEDVVSVFMQDAEADDPAEVPAEQLLAFIQEQAGAGGEEPEEQPEESEMSEAAEERIRELEDRLEAIESEPQPPTDLGGGDEDGERPMADGEPVPVRDGLRSDGTYIGR